MSAQIEILNSRCTLLLSCLSVLGADSVFDAFDLDRCDCLAQNRVSGKVILSSFCLP